MNRALLVTGGGATFAASVMAGYLISRKPPADVAGVELPPSGDRVKTYDSISSSYDEQISWDEKVPPANAAVTEYFFSLMRIY